MDVSDRLVAEADAEDRRAAAEAADHLLGDPRVLRPARPGGDHDRLRSGALHGIRVEGVIAANVHLGSQLPQVLHEVVGERIVVVDDEDHESPHAAASSASALRHVSSCSRRGSESATIPAPA